MSASAAGPGRVAPAAWLDEVRAAVAEGFDWLDSLHAVDEIGRPETPGGPEQVRVVVRLWRVSDGLSSEGLSGGGGLRRDSLQLQTRVDRVGGVLDSLAEVLPGAVWHEREVHDFFGVRFVGGDDRPLLWHPSGVDAPPGAETPSGAIQAEGETQVLRPLLKDSVLVSRAGLPWPGAKDPETDGRSQASRRRTLPVGVPDPETWGPLAAADVDPAEVAATVSGGRVRRRR
ncbi:NADH-quinone oxidoreductase subunit C [Aestuariimicrobium kwangyangense]|uniref:NADH-quinone oxidoreductase subunit C n=1 Tax=Aestuariimicrobium kwangyangense TaxID=396389 RepID=UPI0003B6B662|nr:NADH-quinone oxidoreductase subunit C [Aestuariimicrobium kwangyangense]